jgi:hypothetical protein
VPFKSIKELPGRIGEDYVDKFSQFSKATRSEVGKAVGEAVDLGKTATKELGKDAGTRVGRLIEGMTEWGHIMKATSRCGLGKTATNSLTMALDKFQDYFKDRFASGPESNTRKFDMEAALAEYEKYKP